MAAGTILTGLKAIPWADVVSNSPALVDGAKKLWGAASRKMKSPEQPLAPVDVSDLDDVSAMARIQGQLDAARADLADLHEQMAASSKLLQGLAEQNARLVQRVELTRKRLTLLSWAFALATIGVACVLALLWPKA